MLDVVVPRMAALELELNHIGKSGVYKTLRVVVRDILVVLTVDLAT